MKQPHLLPTKVSCVFYRAAASRPMRTRVYQLITCQKVSHCSVLFEQGSHKYIYVINPKGGMYLVEYSKYLYIVESQNINVVPEEIPLGTAPVSLVQVSSFVDRSEFKLAPFRENVFWWLIGRHISDTYQPMTCCLAVAYLLRFCGYKVNLQVAPHLLYKELKDGVDNHFWTSSGREDNSSGSTSEGSV